jgi:hypothetical protein
MPDDLPEAGAGLSHTDPIVVGGGSIFIKIPDGFVQAPVPKPRGKNAAATISQLLKHKNKRAKIVKIELSSGTSGEVVCYTPKDGKVEIKIYFEA